MKKITIEDGGLKSIFEWDGLIGLDMADAINAAIVTAMGEKHELDLLWTIAKIRQIVGVNEKPMLSELPEAIQAVIQEQETKIICLETELRQLEVDANEHHADWCNFPPENNEARDFAFSVAKYCRAALGLAA